MTTKSLKFLPAALIIEGPPISIFSMINFSSSVFFNVSSKGYKSTMTKSKAGILYCSISFKSWSSYLLPKMPPKIEGCNVFTLPPKIEG